MLLSIAYEVQLTAYAKRWCLTGVTCSVGALPSCTSFPPSRCHAASMLRSRSDFALSFCFGITSTSRQCHTSTPAGSSASGGAAAACSPAWSATAGTELNGMDLAPLSSVSDFDRGATTASSHFDSPTNTTVPSSDHDGLRNATMRSVAGPLP